LTTVLFFINESHSVITGFGLLVLYPAFNRREYITPASSNNENAAKCTWPVINSFRYTAWQRNAI